VRRAGWGGRFTTTLPSGEHHGTYYTVALGISFAVFVWECHGNIAFSKIVDCIVKRFSWRISPWRLLACHPLGFLS
jgi:hypothetical protein